MNVQTREDFNKFIRDLRSQDYMVVDTETNGLRYYRDNYLISISVYFPEVERVYNLPFRHGQGKVDIRWSTGVPEGTLFQNASWSGNAKKDMYLDYWFKEYAKTADFENLPIEWMEEIKEYWDYPYTHVYHNARFDLHMLHAEGFPIPKAIEDTMIALHIVNEDWRGIGGNRQLKWQAENVLKHPDARKGEELLREAKDNFERQLAEFISKNLADPHNADLVYKTESIRTGPKQLKRIAKKINLNEKSHMWMLPSSAVAPYAELDVLLTWELRCWCLDHIKKWGSVALYAEQCRVLLEVAWMMEANGFKLDVESAWAEVAKLDDAIAEVTAIFDEVGVNVASPSQLINYINKSGMLGQSIDSTSVAVLNEYKDIQFIADILEYRKLVKSRDVYLKKWLSARTPSGYVHTSLNPDGTVSGRMSSSGEAGNLQNIPDRGGYTVKRAIIPPDKDWVIAAIDYGQLEARLAAWIAETRLVKLGVHNEEPVMTRLFNEGVDMHSFTADKVKVREVLYSGLTTEDIFTRLGYSLDSPDAVRMEDIVKKHCRQVGKTLNFGLLYSGGAGMVSHLLKIDWDTAQALVDGWRELFPAFGHAQEYYTNESLIWKTLPTDVYGRKLVQYVKQPLSNRYRKLHKYPTQKRSYQNGRWEVWNPKQAAARKVWNNVVQGLGGWFTTKSMLNFKDHYGWEGMKPFAVIHDAIDFYVHRDYLHKVPLLQAEMVAFPTNPLQTTELEAGTNWQEMKVVKNTPLWIESRGYDGY